MAGEHEVVPKRLIAFNMRGILQGFLNAEAAWISFFAGGKVIMVFPVGKTAMA